MFELFQQEDSFLKSDVVDKDSTDKLLADNILDIMQVQDVQDVQEPKELKEQSTVTEPAEPEALQSILNDIKTLNEDELKVLQEFINKEID